MSFLLYLSEYLIPFVIFYIVGFGLLMRVNVFTSFLKGAEESFRVVMDIAPTLIALMVSVGILRASGVLDYVTDFLEPIMERVHFPGSLVPLALMKTVSSSAATGLLLDIFKEYGVDSYISRVAAITITWKGITE